jgi:hypothetical protein
MTDSPELAAAKRLLDEAKDQGFRFVRLAPGEDGPLRGVRDTPDHRDEIYRLCRTFREVGAVPRCGYTAEHANRRPGDETRLVSRPVRMPSIVIRHTR